MGVQYIARLLKEDPVNRFLEENYCSNDNAKVSVYTLFVAFLCLCVCAFIPVVDGRDEGSYNTLSLTLHKGIMKRHEYLLWHHQ